jgi:hypothetical protein
MKKTYIVSLLTLFSAVFFSAFVQGKACISIASENDKKLKAEQILKQAKDTISKKINLADLKGFSIQTKRSEELSIASRPDRKIQGTAETELSAMLPDKIRQTYTGDYSTNQSKTLLVLNGNQLHSKVDVFVDGKPVNTDFGAVTSKEGKISQLKYETFLTMFPITLDASWYTPLEFQYVGSAESKDGKADVIETALSNNTKYRLFFDQQTHLLLLMTQSWISKGTNKEIEKKYFFSDYKVVDGLLVAHKVIVERDGKVVEETEVKKFQVNPTFKADFFEVKEK